MQTDIKQGAIEKQNAPCVVVFRGLGSGVFDDWLDCAELVVAVPRAIFQGYSTRSDGEKMYELAKQNGDIEIFTTTRR